MYWRRRKGAIWERVVISRKMKRSTLRDVVANRLGLDPSDDVLERKVNEFCLFYMEDGAWED